MCPNYWLVVYTVHAPQNPSQMFIPRVTVPKYPLEITVLTLQVLQTGYVYIHICVAFKTSEPMWLTLLQWSTVLYWVSLWCCSMNPCSWSYATNNHSWLTPLEVWKSEGEWAESVQYPSSEWSRRVEGSQSQCRVLLVSQPEDRVTDRERERGGYMKGG